MWIKLGLNCVCSFIKYLTGMTMKTLLLSTLLILSPVHIHAYDGATKDFLTAFMTSISEKTTEKIVDNNNLDADQYACLTDIMTPIMMAVAKDYAQSLPKEQVSMLDAFFDRPLGREIMDKVQLVGHRVFDVMDMDGVRLYYDDIDAINELGEMLLGLPTAIDTPEVFDEMMNVKDECGV